MARRLRGSCLGTALAALVLLSGCMASPRVVGVKRPYAEPLGSVPRVVLLPEVANCRDLGGWKGLEGRTVRQGRIFRSGCINERWRWYRPGCSNDFLSERTRGFLVGGLGIRTEVDLRKEINCRGMEGSPLGPGVRYFNISSKAYGNLASPEGREAFRKAFRVFLDEANYPILFHCIGGNDRAGSLAFILNGLLGVSQEDLRRDWEFSRIWHGGEFEYEDRLAHLVRVFDAYEGATLCARIENYVLSLGFTSDDIVRFRKLMLSDR